MSAYELDNVRDDCTSIVVSESTNDWQPEHEALLESWKAKLFVQMWLQERSMYFYRDINNYLTYPIIAISSISSATLFSTNNEIVKNVIGALTLTTGVLTAITRQMRPAELYQQHAIATLRYQTLIRTINTYLSLPKSMRDTDPKTFMQKIEMDISALMENQINAPPYIKRKFEKKYGNIDKLVYGEEILTLLRSDMLRHAEEMKSKRKNTTISQYLFRSR